MERRCNVCGKAGGRRILFRYYRGAPWLCKDERACYSRRHLAWVLDNFEERERARFKEAIARRKEQIRVEVAARAADGKH